MDKVLESNLALDKIISTIGDLPATPVIIASLMNLTSDINTDIEKITKNLISDQSLTARVLKLANSSFYGRAKAVATLKEAIVLLGFNTLRSLVLATSTHRLYQNGENDEVQDKLWEHSLATAIASRMLAEKSGCGHAEEAFIAGLLHDIGKLVLTQKLPEEYGKVIQRVEKNQLKFIDVEDEQFGFNHTDVAFLLLHKWSFPAEIVNSVYEHHAPKKNEDDKGISLAYFLNLGSMMAKKLGVGFNDFHYEDLFLLPAATILNFDEESLEEMQVSLEEKFKEEKEIFASAL